MDINWIDETGTVQGTPVNRARLMGMQGFLPFEGTITKGANSITITETNADYGTTETRIDRGTNQIVVWKRFYPAGETAYVRVITRLVKQEGGDISVRQTIGTYGG